MNAPRWPAKVPMPTEVKIAMVVADDKVTMEANDINDGDGDLKRWWY